MVVEAAQELLNPWAGYSVVGKNKLPHGFWTVPHVSRQRCHCGIREVVVREQDAPDRHVQPRENLKELSRACVVDAGGANIKHVQGWLAVVVLRITRCRMADLIEKTIHTIRQRAPSD